MNTTLFLAQVLGLYFTLTAIALFINRPSFIAFFKEAAHQRHIIILSGFISLMIGLGILVANHLWHGVALLITIIGLIAVISGLLRIFFTEWCAHHIKRMTGDSAYYILCAVLLAVGIVLIYFGFVAI